MGAAVVLVAAYGALVALMPGVAPWSGAAVLAGLMVLPAACASAILVSIAGRVDPQPGNAWLTVMTTAVAVQGIPWVALSTGRAGEADRLLLAYGLVLGVAAVLILNLAFGSSLRLGPGSLGLAIGLLTAVARITISQVVPEEMSREAMLAAAVAVVVAAWVIALAMQRASALPKHVTDPLCVAMVLWSINGALLFAGLAASPFGAVVAVGAGLGASVLLTRTSLAILRDAARLDQSTCDSLREQIESCEAEARADQDHLHEVKGSIAGIASASELICNEARLSSQHRARLQDMIAAESARLQRLVHGGGVTEAENVDLDELLRPLVVSRRAQGHQVFWVPSGRRVLGRRDDIAEVVNILLDNAVKHDPHGFIQVSTRRRRRGLELVVADSGPGVPESVRADLFRRGSRGPTSTGQGIGLAVAHRLMDESGSYLELDPEHQPGAAFIVGLTVSDQEEAGERADLAG